MNRWLISPDRTVIRRIVSISLALALAAPIMTTPPAGSQQAVVCTNCGTEWTQLYNKALMAKQYLAQAQQLKAEIGQYQDMLLNSKGAPTHLWGKAMQDFQRLTALMQHSRSLAFSTGNLDGQFARRYQGYQAYASGKLNWRDKYNQWSSEGADNTLSAMRAANLQYAAMDDENALLQRLQAMSQNSQGRMEALQIANMLAAQNVEQIQKLRQLMMSLLQMQANWIQQQQDEKDAQRAAHDKLWTNWKENPYNDGKSY